MCNTNNTNFAGTRDAANRTIRFDIRQGKLAQWMGQGQQAREYDYVQGYLTGISLRKHEMPTGEMTYLDVHFKNGEIRFDVSANCVVYENSEKLPFRILPKVERKQKGFSTSYDTSERDAAVMTMIDELNGRIAQASRSENARN